MGSKYEILYKKYGEDVCWRSFATNDQDEFFEQFAAITREYEIVDVQFRDFEAMNKAEAEREATHGK